MLPGGALDVDAAGGKPVFFRLADGHVALGEIFFDVAVSGFFGDRADGAGAEDMVGAEHLDAVGMSPRLIFAREVEVDIGDLVAAEAEEGFKRDIESVLIELRAAFRAHRVGKVRAAGAVVRDFEGGKLALRAPVVRREGVDLCDAGHERND